MGTALFGLPGNTQGGRLPGRGPKVIQFIHVLYVQVPYVHVPLKIVCVFNGRSLEVIVILISV